MEELQVKVTSKETFGKFKDVRDLIERTNKENPKPADVDELRRLFAENPNLWKFAGDVAERATRHIIATYATSKFVRESQERAVEVMREECGHASAPPLERILIEQIIICWLRLNTLEIHYTTKTFESHTTEAGLYWDKRLTNAQRRFTRACESLARVRRLARPNVQVNIAAEGGRQINVA